MKQITGTIKMPLELRARIDEIQALAPSRVLLMWLFIVRVSCFVPSGCADHADTDETTSAPVEETTEQGEVR